MHLHCIGLLGPRSVLFMITHHQVQWPAYCRTCHLIFVCEHLYAGAVHVQHTLTKLQQHHQAMQPPPSSVVMEDGDIMLSCNSMHMQMGKHGIRTLHDMFFCKNLLPRTQPCTAVQGCHGEEWIAWSCVMPRVLAQCATIANPQCMMAVSPAACWHAQSKTTTKTASLRHTAGRFQGTQQFTPRGGRRC